MNDIVWNCNTEGTICTISASDPFFIPFFSSGDIMISVLLLLLVLFELVKFLRAGISSVKIIRKYQGNNSPDGKEFYNI